MAVAPGAAPGAAGRTRGTRPWRQGLSVALVFLVALNLRPALTSVGPLLPQLGEALALSESRQGLLGALPLLAFAAVSPLVRHPAGRFGKDRVVLAALLGIAAGALVRSYGGQAGLWVGTLLLGGAIAVGNVLVPAIVKRDYPDHVSLATGVYSACITVAAALASALTVPLAGLAGWPGSLACWAVPALAVALCWLPRCRTPEGSGAAAVTRRPGGSVWRQPAAWLVTLFMGLQSTTFYLVVTWLPTIETAAGFSAEEAGLHLFAFQLLGVPAGLAIPWLMRRPGDLTAAAVTASVPMVAGVAGLLLAPALSPVWASVAGAGSGASLVVALSLISLRGRGRDGTTALSGMAQSVGYLMAAAGPVLAGHLAERTGGWHVPLLFLGAVALAQVVAAVAVGPDRPAADG